MVKSNQQVINAYEKSGLGGADEMNFSEILLREQEKLNSEKRQAEKRKTAKTPILPRSYTDCVERYRTVPYMTKVADMKVFNK